MNELLTLELETTAVMVNRMHNLIDSFINTQDVKPSSKDTYRKALNAFMRWLSAHGILNPSREDILSYKGFLQSQGLSSFTVSGYITVVRKFFEYMEFNIGYQNVAKGIKGAVRSKVFRKEPLTIEQIKELLEYIDRSTICGLRDYALLNLMLRTGLRTIEVIRAEVGDIRQQSGEALLWIHGKGRDSKDEFVLLTQDTLKPLYEYLQARGRVEDSSPLFTSLSDRNKDQMLTTRSIRRIVKEHLKGIGLNSNKLSAHSLRHTFATIALMNGAPILQVKEVMRHKNIDTTTIYAHAIDRINNGAERYVRF